MDDETTTIEAPAPEPATEPKRGPGRPRGSSTKNRTAPPADKAPRGPGRPSKNEQLRRQLGEAIAMLGLAAMPFAPADGSVIIRHAPQLADSLGHLADTDPRVARLLSGGLQNSAWLGVVFAFGGLTLELLALHNVLPPAVAALFTAKPSDLSSMFPAPASDGAR